MDLRQSQEQSPYAAQERREERVNFDNLFVTSEPLETKTSYGRPLTKEELTYRTQVYDNAAGTLQEVGSWLKTNTVAEAMLVQFIKEGALDSNAIGGAISEKAAEFYTQYSRSFVVFDKSINEKSYEMRGETSELSRRITQSQIDQFKIVRDSHALVSRDLKNFIGKTEENPRQYSKWVNQLIDAATPILEERLVQLAAGYTVEDVEKYLYKVEASLEDTQQIAPPSKGEQLVGSEAARRVLTL